MLPARLVVRATPAATAPRIGMNGYAAGVHSDAANCCAQAKDQEVEHGQCRLLAVLEPLAVVEIEPKDALYSCQLHLPVGALWRGDTESP